jgi:hypothetical protein
MNGPQHFRQAEKLLEHAASMLDTDVAPEDRAELVQRQAALASMATAHAALAARERPQRAPGPGRRTSLARCGRQPDLTARR